MEELLPECLRLTTDYMNERIRFLVEQSGFFPSSFLVQEGLISADRLLPMFGVTGLAEAVNHLLRDRGLVYGRDGEADALGVRIMEKIDAVVKTLPAAHSPDREPLPAPRPGGPGLRRGHHLRRAYPRGE